ncbi:MAG: hypothetical protein HKN44_02670 [Ilumatobacter sp.]|nr:hypothetical protein [Ilumatobacter sp.]
MSRRPAIAAALVAVALGCSSDPAPSEPLAADVRAAVAAVEAARGGPQEFFEVTATPQLTNVFVAIDDAGAAVPYVYLDGELQPPAPRLDGAAGHTFTADALDFDDATVLSGVRSDLPAATIDAFSVEGTAGGFVRYVVSVRSEQGGVLDVVVAPRGAVVEVNPL